MGVVLCFTIFLQDILCEERILISFKNVLSLPFMVFLYRGKMIEGINSIFDKSSVAIYHPLPTENKSSDIDLLWLTFLFVKSFPSMSPV